MKRKVTWLVLSAILMIGLILSSCAQKTTPATTQTTSGPVTTQTTAATSKPASTTTTQTTAPTAKPAPTSPKYGGTLNFVNKLLPSTLDPADGTSNSKTILNFVYDRLLVGDWSKGQSGTNEWPFTVAGPFTPIEYTKGSLAESWKMPDNKTVIFNIRKGIRFALDPGSAASQFVGGREIDAFDIEANIVRYTANKGAQFQGRAFYDSAKALDKWTIEFKWKVPYFDPITGAANMPMYAPELVKKYGNLLDWKVQVGTGPFIWTDYLTESSATFKKNPTYWAHDELNPQNQIPYVDGVNFYFIAEPSMIDAAVRAGKIDNAVFNFSNISKDSLDSVLKTNPDILYNPMLDNPKPRFHFKTDEPPFNNVKVRQAMAMAIDFETIKKTVNAGGGSWWVYPVRPEYKSLYRPLSAYPKEVQDIYTYNPAKAKQLLADAGYPKGITVDLVTSSLYTDQATIFQEYWKAIGAITNVKLIDNTQLKTLLIGKKGWQGINASSTGFDNPYDALLMFTLSGNAQNYTSYSDATNDKLLNDMAAETDSAKLKAKMWAAADYVRAQVPFLDFPQPETYSVWQPWLKNYHGEAGLPGGGHLAFADVAARLWIDQELKKKYVR